MRATIAAIAVALCLSGPVSANDHVPFRGTLTGDVTVTPANPPVVSVVIEGAGNATQLGRFSVAIPHTVNQATRQAAGMYVFTAANGDTLTASFSGQATLVAPGVLTVAETGTITGGTGRFEGATGSFSTARTFLVATGTTTGTFNGWISTLGD